MFKPLLAVDADLDKLVFPLLASAKLDGVRAVVREGVVYSRSNKPIPNKCVQLKFGHLWHFDGELIVGDPTSKSCYRDTVSTVMSHDKSASDVSFYAFDHVEHPRLIYGGKHEGRFSYLHEKSMHLYVHDQVMCLCLEDVLDYENERLADGYEGLILRSMDAPYKMGRSTVKEGYLLKLKRFSDDEATIIGFEERMKNNNEKVTNELGRGQRSSHAAGKEGRGDLGALIMRRTDGTEFSVGTGFDDHERQLIWDNQGQYLGQLGKYKHFAVGAKDKPRHPVWLGLRDRRDT